VLRFVFSLVLNCLCCWDIRVCAFHRSDGSRSRCRRRWKTHCWYVYWYLTVMVAIMQHVMMLEDPTAGV